MKSLAQTSKTLNFLIMKYDKKSMIEISCLKPNSANPRRIKKSELNSLKKSLLEFPQMLAVRGIVVDNDGTVIGGNMRLLAIKNILEMSEEEIASACKDDKSLSIWLEVVAKKSIPASWVLRASEMTEEQKRRFSIIDNVQAGEWDFKSMFEWFDKYEIKEWMPGLHSAFFAEINKSEDSEAVLNPDANKEVNIISVVIDIKTENLDKFLTEIKPILSKYEATCYAS